MPLGPNPNPNYPSLETCLNTVRAFLNDSFAGATSTPGEGQIITDQVPGTTTNNPFVLNLLNHAIRTLYRKLRITHTASLIQDNYLLIGLPVIDSPTYGGGTSDPTVQNYLDSFGFFDGVTLWPQWTLPPDIMSPIAMWERTTGTNDTFIRMTPARLGLSPASQVDRMREFEWRFEKIYMPGATTSRDLRLRYQAVFPQFFAPSMNFSATFIPVVDCEDYVALKTCVPLALALGSAQVSGALDKMADDALFDLRNERVRRMQNIDYTRQAYDDQDTANELDVYGI
jgi:hypothetical protein